MDICNYTFLNITNRQVQSCKAVSLRINTLKSGIEKTVCQLHFKSNNLTMCLVMITLSAKDGGHVVVLKCSGVFSSVVHLWWGEGEDGGLGWRVRMEG